MNKKAVALFSGGLDSTLAIKLVLEQGVDVICLHFSTPFASGKIQNQIIKKIAEQLSLRVENIELKEEYLEIVKNPKFGYGANLNPCIDCKILMLKKAKEIMQKEEASFIITGEVVNQRGMSQRKPVLELIEKETDVVGLVLRPLSAKLLQPTFAEINALVDREKLLNIYGRSRKIQLELATKYGIKHFLTPAGGCLLTDPNFSKRMKVLMKDKPNFDLEDIALLKIGRHFKINSNSKLIVGRNEKENNMLDEFAKKQSFYLFDVINTYGPKALGIGEFTEEEINYCCRIIARYSDKISEGVRIKISKNGYFKEYVCDELVPQYELEELRI